MRSLIHLFDARLKVCVMNAELNFCKNWLSRCSQEALKTEDGCVVSVMFFHKLIRENVKENVKGLKRRRAVATFKLDKHFSFRLVARSRYLVLMRWEWMDLVKLREREEREREEGRGGEREGGGYYSVCEEETGGEERRGAEERTRLDAETEPLPLEPLKQPR